jgi:hypothetical protein
MARGRSFLLLASLFRWQSSLLLLALRSSLYYVSALSEARFQEKGVHEHGAPARVRYAGLMQIQLSAGEQTTPETIPLNIQNDLPTRPALFDIDVKIVIGESKAAQVTSAFVSNNRLDKFNRQQTAHAANKQL